jgi:hypothetical protein
MPSANQKDFGRRRDETSPEEDPFKDLKTCPVISYCESHLLRLPWSVLDPSRRRSTRIEVDVDGDLFAGGGDRRWRVLAGRRGLPGPFEMSVFRALEWIALEQSIARGVRFENPLYFHLRELCERLCLKELASNFRAIDRSVRLLTELEIECTFLPRAGRPAPQRYFPSRFKLINRILFDRRPGPDRRPASWQHALYFDRFFVDSVNSGRVRPLNWGLWIALRRPLSRRLMEIVEFDPQAEAAPEVALPVDRLARLLPVKGGFDARKWRAELERAHEELIGHQHFSTVEWRAVGGEPCVVYRAGIAQDALRLRLRRDGRALLPARATPSTLVGTG